MQAAEVAIDRGGFVLAGWTAGEPADRTILCIHETATSAAVWRPLADIEGGKALVAAYDRRGWGGSGAPPDYRRTTIEEHAADAEAVIDALGSRAVTVCGAGIGAVIALELTVHRPELVSAAMLVEPPLFALVPEATAPISADVEAIRKATVSAGARIADDAEPSEAAAAGAKAARELYLGGGLAVLGAGSERIPPELADADHANPFVLFAEVAAISGWTLPLAELPALAQPIAVAVASSTPPFVRRAAEALSSRLPGADLRELPAGGLPQLDSPAELASVLSELG